jgi:hypothetical protein
MALMGLLEKLLGKLRPLELEDEFFGPLVYMKMPRGKISYWEARRAFSPTGAEVELFLDAPAPEQPPDATQREFFAEVERRYAELMSAVEPLLRSAYERWRDEPLTGALDEEFTLGSFSIPHAPMAGARWEMTFDSRSDDEHLFSIEMEGGRPRGTSP